LQQINIFRYLNKNELYLWEERLRIAEDLNRILGSRQEIEEKLQLSNVDNKNDKGDIEANNGFAVVDFTSNNNYAYTKPTKLVLRGITRKTRSWKDVLMQLCELLISNAPNVIKTLVEIPLTEDSIRIHFSLTKTGMFFPKKLSNGMWVETNYSATNGLNFLSASISVYKGISFLAGTIENLLACSGFLIKKLIYWSIFS
jgi:hypothetical protein